VARQDLLPPLVLSPQLRATAGQPFTIYGVDFETVTEFAGVRLDGNLIDIFPTNEDSPFEAAVTIPSGTTAGVHVLTLVCDNVSASMNLDVCTTDNGDGCQAMIGILSASPAFGLPVDTVITGPYLNFSPGATFKVIGEGFWTGSLSLSVDSGSSLLGEVVADSTGHFVSPQFTLPWDLPWGQHNITAVQSLGCRLPYCFHEASTAETPFSIITPPKP
jgi:hypothetical protein